MKLSILRLSAVSLYLGNNSLCPIWFWFVLFPSVSWCSVVHRLFDGIDRLYRCREGITTFIITNVRWLPTTAEACRNSRFPRSVRPLPWVRALGLLHPTTEWWRCESELKRRSFRLKTKWVLFSVRIPYFPNSSDRQRCEQRMAFAGVGLGTLPFGTVRGTCSWRGWREVPLVLRLVSWVLRCRNRTRVRCETWPGRSWRSARIVRSKECRLVGFARWRSTPWGYGQVGAIRRIPLGWVLLWRIGSGGRSGIGLVFRVALGSPDRGRWAGKGWSSSSCFDAADDSGWCREENRSTVPRRIRLLWVELVRARRELRWTNSAGCDDLAGTGSSCHGNVELIRFDGRSSVVDAAI